MVFVIPIIFSFPLCSVFSDHSLSIPMLLLSHIHLTSMASDLALPTLKLTKYFISLDLVFRQNRLIKFIAISAGIFCIRYFLEMHVIIISWNSKTISKIQDMVGMELGQNYSNVKEKIKQVFNILSYLHSTDTDLKFSKIGWIFLQGMLPIFLMNIYSFQYEMKPLKIIICTCSTETNKTSASLFALLVWPRRRWVFKKQKGSGVGSGTRWQKLPEKKMNLR